MLTSIEQDQLNYLLFLNEISQQYYEELYQPEADGTASIKNDLNEVLKVLRSDDQTLSHLRYLWMTLILTLVVEPTLESYQPNNSLPKNIIKVIVLGLYNTINGSIAKNLINTEELFNRLSNYRNYSNLKNIANFQVINEAIDVFENALRVLDYGKSVEAILAILDDCLEGYAIFPGSSGRRELFDWWLEDVVRASLFLEPPKSFFVVEGLQCREYIQLRRTNFLKQISLEVETLSRMNSEFKSKLKTIVESLNSPLLDF